MHYANESTEPLVGCLGIGAHALMHSEGISYKPLGGEVELCLRVGGWGRLSENGAGHYNPIRSVAAKLVGVLAGESPGELAQLPL